MMSCPLVLLPVLLHIVVSFPSVDKDNVSSQTVLIYHLESTACVD